MASKIDIRTYIRTVPDFPKSGIQFRDVTTLFADLDGFKATLDQLETAASGLGIQAVAGIDARGFIVGGALADRLGVGFYLYARRASCRA
jgi:adenine phosphoribosyltransferase